jgi:hypothetical protein
LSNVADKQTVAQQDLRLASDNFLTRVERLHALEVQKRELPAEETAELALEVEALSREVLEWAVRQSELAEEVAASSEAAQPISTTPPRAINIVLDEWRAAERALEGEQPATAAWESARADIDRLRDEYARAYHAQVTKRG